MTIVLSAAVSSLAFLPNFASNISTAQSSTSSAGELRSDFNGDGFADIAISALRESLGSADYAGAVNVIYGSSAGLGATSAPDGSGRADQFWHQGSPGIEEAPGQFDEFGLAMSSGDFNGDGYYDLAIGVPGEDLGFRTDAGAVNVVYGSSQGLRSSPAGDGTGLEDQLWTQNNEGIEDTSQKTDDFGVALASGDFDDDGYDDLAISVRDEALGDFNDAGAVNVIYGSSQGLRATAALDGTGRADQFWHQNSPGIEDSVEAHDAFGEDLATGDFNNDGYADLAIGVSGESVGTADAAGAVNIIYGSSQGLRATAVGPGDGHADQFWTQNSQGIADSSERADIFGSVLATADFNEDAFDDLAVGVYSEGLGPLAEVGALHIIYGSAAGLSATAVPDQFWTQNSGSVEDTAEAHDLFGWALASGLFNEDNYADLAISVFGESTVHIIYGSAAGLSATAVPDQLLTRDSLGIESPPASGGPFGISSSAGDFNDDGQEDLAVGGGKVDFGSGLVEGSVYIVHGSSGGLSPTFIDAQVWTQDSNNIEDTAEQDDFFGYSVWSR